MAAILVYNDLLTGEEKTAGTIKLSKMENFIKNAHYRQAEKEGENCAFCKNRFSHSCNKLGTGKARTTAAKIDFKYTCSFFKP